MTTDDTTIDEVYKYLRKMRSAYAEADQTKKGRMLDDMERVTGRHRKSLIRLLQDAERCRRQRQPGAPTRRTSMRHSGASTSMGASALNACILTSRHWLRNSPSTMKWTSLHPCRRKLATVGLTTIARAPTALPPR